VKLVLAVWILCSVSVEIFFFPIYSEGVVSAHCCFDTGLNLARMFGDKFLKEQDPRFSSEPYVSQAVRITKACTAFAVIAR
jgi:hypothetical protein